MISPTIEKRNHIRVMVFSGRSVIIKLDPRHERCLVPERFTKQEELNLLIGMNLVIPIPDLDLQEEGIVATLSFERKPYACFIPWEAITDVWFEGDVAGYSWRPFFQKTGTSKPVGEVAKKEKPKFRVTQGGKA